MKPWIFGVFFGQMVGMISSIAKPPSHVIQKQFEDEYSLPSDPKIKAKIDHLIAQLGSKTYQVRKTAFEQLIKMDSPAVIQLYQASKNATDPEIRWRSRQGYKLILRKQQVAIPHKWMQKALAQEIKLVYNAKPLDEVLLKLIEKIPKADRRLLIALVLDAFEIRDSEDNVDKRELIEIAGKIRDIFSQTLKAIPGVQGPDGNGHFRYKKHSFSISYCTWMTRLEIEELSYRRIPLKWEKWLIKNHWSTPMYRTLYLNRPVQKVTLPQLSYKKAAHLVMYPDEPQWEPQFSAYVNAELARLSPQEIGWQGLFTPDYVAAGIIQWFAQLPKHWDQAWAPSRDSDDN